MALCLVTGDPGLIGAHLVEALLTQGHAVRILDDRQTSGTAGLNEVADRIEIMTGSLTDLGSVRAATAGVELVFHQTGHSAALGSIDDHEAIHHACTTSTLLILMAARESGVRRVIFSSSASVYGRSGKLPRREDDPTSPVSLYGVAQLAGEQYCKIFSQLFGLETVRLRCFNVFGPERSLDGSYAGVIPAFLQLLLVGQSPVIYGDGEQTRDFTFVGDVVQANLLAATACRVSGKVYNIGFGRETSLLELVGCMNELLGTHVKPIHANPQPGDVRHCVADTALAQTELGFCPCTDLREGLRKCIEAYRDRRITRGAAEFPPKPHLRLVGAKNPQISSGS
jgi:nucleoside-diphosphate-sugar epimerase